MTEAPGGGLPEGGVYVDSPIPAAIRQIAPFYRQGVFHEEGTPLFMRKRVSTAFGALVGRSLEGIPVRMVDGKTSVRLPVRRGGAIFYGFNSQGNMHTVANRSYRHVLALHGESNKRASARPAARLYDHVCVAGEIAVSRYLRNGIFRPEDADNGRLILVGDTFVQSLEGYHVDAENGDCVLYAPTWEGYGGEINDYSSVSMGGMMMAERVAHLTDRPKIVIRPHPYLGLLKPGLLRRMVADALDVSRRRDVLFDLRDANLVTRLSVRAASLISGGRIGVATGDQSVSVCLSDVSAIEAVCLKERLPNFVLRKNFRINDDVRDFYERKSAGSTDELDRRFPAYIASPQEVDAPHREATFSVSHPDLASPDGAVRRARIMKLIGAQAL